MRVSIAKVVFAGLFAVSGVLAQFGGPVCGQSGDAPYTDCEAAIAILNKKLPEPTTTCNTTVPVTAYRFASSGNCTIASYDPLGTAHCRQITHVIRAAQEVMDWCWFSDDNVRGAVNWRDLRLTGAGRNYNGNVTVGHL